MEMLKFADAIEETIQQLMITSLQSRDLLYNEQGMPRTVLTEDDLLIFVLGRKKQQPQQAPLHGYLHAPHQLHHSLSARPGLTGLQHTSMENKKVQVIHDLNLEVGQKLAKRRIELLDQRADGIVADLKEYKKKTASLRWKARYRGLDAVKHLLDREELILPDLPLYDFPMLLQGSYRPNRDDELQFQLVSSVSHALDKKLFQLHRWDFLIRNEKNVQDQDKIQAVNELISLRAKN
jgi:hypothetical protein